MKLKSRVFIYFGSTILVFVLSIYYVNYTSYRVELGKIAREELKDKVELINHSVTTVLNNSVINYLNGMTSQHLSVIESLYRQYESGEIEYEEFKKRVQNYSNRIIGETGYFVCLKVEDDATFLEIHPYMPGQESTATEASAQWLEIKNGYLEYEWINPDEATYRHKVAYLKYFEPIPWIVGATTYKDELASLIDIDDVRSLIVDVSFKDTGYFFLFDDKGDVLIHPEMEGTNVVDMVNDEGVNVAELFWEVGIGFVEYSWQNPSETKSRKKIAYITQTDFYNWNLVGSVYLDEIYEPVQSLGLMTFLIVIITTLLVVILGLHFSRNLERQLSYINIGISRFYEENVPFKMRKGFIFEVDNLGWAFEKASEEIVKSRGERERLLELLESIINSMPSELIAIDDKKKILLWNKKVTERTGVSVNEAVGQNLMDVLPELESIEFSLETGKEGKISRTRNSEDTVYYDEIVLFPFRKEEITGIVIRIDDITEDRHLREALLHSQKMDALGQLTGGIAHDFNNMIAGILNSVQLLENKTDGSEKALKFIRLIKDTSIRAGELTGKLLHFSRKNEFVKTPEHLHEIITRAINILQASIDKKLAITSDFSAEQDSILANFTQMQNVCINLGINASHAIEGKGSLTFRTSLKELGEDFCKASSFDIFPGVYICLEVEDSGKGIPESLLDKIFDPFFTTKEQGKGTGLGLSTVFGIVTQHRGAISVKSELEKGSVFSIFLPLSEELTIKSVSAEEKWSYGSGTILLIEDEEVIRESTYELLSELGYKVICASNGREGVELFTKNQTLIDLVFTDMIMPDMNGKDAFREFRKLNPYVKVVFCSGFTEDADINEINTMGAQGFIAKPYNPEAMSHLIYKVMMA